MLPGIFFKTNVSVLSFHCFLRTGIVGTGEPFRGGDDKISDYGGSASRDKAAQDIRSIMHDEIYAGKAHHRGNRQKQPRTTFFCM